MGVTLSPHLTYLKHCDTGYLYGVCHLIRWGVSRVIHGAGVGGMRYVVWGIGMGITTRRATRGTASLLKGEASQGVT